MEEKMNGRTGIGFNGVDTAFSERARINQQKLLEADGGDDVPSIMQAGQLAPGPLATSIAEINDRDYGNGHRAS